MQPLPVGGLRLQPALTLIRVEHVPPPGTVLIDYLSLLDLRRINLPFLALSTDAGMTTATLCVAAGERERAMQAALRFPTMVSHLTALSPVCAISVFPHRNETRLLGHLLATLRQAEVPLLAMGSSIASQVCVIAETDLPCAITALEDALCLPANHSPIRLQLRHEPVVRRDET